MRILVFSDPHISPKSTFSQPLSDGLTTYLKQVIDTFAWLIKLVRQEDPDLIVCLGDVTDTTGYVDATTLKVAMHCFSTLAEEACGILVLVGNHDSYSTQHNIHNLEFLKGIQGISVVEKAGPCIEDTNIWCLPWGTDPNLEVPDNVRVIFSHLDIEGSCLYKTKKADFGADPESFKAFVFNGHIHNPGAVTNNVYNIGAVLSRSFQDVDSPPRGAYVIDASTPAIEKFIPNPYDAPYRDIRIDTPDAAKKLQQAIDEGVTKLDGCYVRIKHTVEYKELAEQLSYLTQGARRETIGSSTTKTIAVPRLSKDHFSAEQAFARYHLRETVDLSDSQKIALTELGLAFLKQAASEIRVHAMPIEFERIEACHFQSLGIFALQLNQGGLWYVAGRNEDDPYDANGVGKSTIHEAIYWCATGESLRGYKADDVIHWNYESCWVKLWLKIGETRYCIYRSRKDPTAGTVVELYDCTTSGVHPVELGRRRKSDTNELIAELIGRSKRVLQHSVFLTSGLAHKFTSLSYPDRIRLIEEITDVEVFAKASKLVDKEFSKIVSHQYTLKGALAALEQSVKRSEVRILELIQSFDKLRVEAQPRLQQLEKNREQYSREITSLQTVCDGMDAEVGLVQNRLQALETKHRIFADEHSKLVVQINSLDTTASLTESRVIESETLISQGNCPTCGQLIQGDAPCCVELDKLRHELLDLDQRKQPFVTKYARLEEGRARLKMVYDSDRVHSQTLIDELRNARHRLADLEKAANQLLIESESINSKLSSADAVIAEQHKLKEIASAELDSTRVQLKDSEYRSELFLWLLQAFSTTGIRADVLFQVSLPFLNTKLVEYSEKLGQPCHLDYRETKSGDLEEKVDVSLPGKKVYKGLSRGEKMMVDLSIQCALNDLAIATGGSHINLLICDEVIDSIDETTLNSFVEVLESKALSTTIFLMAHRPFLDARLSNKLMLVKKDGITYVEST